MERVEFDYTFTLGEEDMKELVFLHVKKEYIKVLQFLHKKFPRHRDLNKVKSLYKLQDSGHVHL